MQSPLPLPNSDRDAWLLPTDWVFLNPGSFGLRLRSVHEARVRMLERMESQPVAFLEREAMATWSHARASLAAFVGGDPEGFGFVSNATEGIDAVLAQPAVRSGRVLVSELAYGAVKEASRWGAATGDGEVHEVRSDLPINDPNELVDAWDAALGRGAALAIVDHITSGTALVHPVKDIVERCRAHGVPVLVDGAHAPGMLELQVEAIGADWYVGNLHKWVGAPSGAGFIWTAPQRRQETRPLALSHDCGGTYEDAFRWQGTRDVTPWLVVPEAIASVEQRWGWSTLRAWQRDMAVWAGRRMAEAFETVTADGTGGLLTGAMVSARLPEGAPSGWADRFALRDAIASRHRVELAVDAHRQDWWARLSFGPWVTTDDVERAIDAVLQTIHNP